MLKDKFRVLPEDVGVIEGGTARLECAPPRGSPAPTVYWKKSGKVIDLENEHR